MARKSLASTYDRLEQRRDELVNGQRDLVPGAVAPSAVHVQAVKVLGDLLTMGQLFSTGKVPPALRAMMRALKHMEPDLVRELAVVPPEQIKEFLRDLSARLLSIVDADGSDRPALTAGQDQSPT